MDNWIYDGNDRMCLKTAVLFPAKRTQVHNSLG